MLPAIESGHADRVAAAVDDNLSTDDRDNISRRIRDAFTDHDESAAATDG